MPQQMSKREYYKTTKPHSIFTSPFLTIPFGGLGNGSARLKLSTAA